LIERRITVIRFPHWLRGLVVFVAGHAGLLGFVHDIMQNQHCEPLLRA
jgi:hypothetical protein